MQITVNVINPINDQEVEVTLDINTTLTLTFDGKKLLLVSANGATELP